MNGIQSIDLLPASGEFGIASKLQAALGTAKCLRAAVAYWCVGPRQLGQKLVTRLGDEGFLCVDIHLPTDIDILAQMSAAGANIYLYLKDPNPQPGELKSKVPPHLLHPKLLLFDYSEGPSDLWVGSHNWTARALTGINIEGSLRVRLAIESALYSEAAAFLDRVRSRCLPFDLGAVDYYKWLQGAALDEPTWVLEVAGGRALLDTHRRLTVFGQSDEDYTNLKSVDKTIVLSLFEQDSDKEILYEAVIADTGRLTQAGVGFDARLYALQGGLQRPQVVGPASPPASVLTTARSWATISLGDELYGVTFELPPAERWTPVDEGAKPALSTAELRNWFREPTRTLVQVPVPREVFERRLSEESRDLIAHHSREALVTKGAVQEVRRLLRRKIVRAKRHGGDSFSVSKRKSREDKESP